jgi:hypothetical protein
VVTFFSGDSVLQYGELSYQSSCVVTSSAVILWFDDEECHSITIFVVTSFLMILCFSR